MPARLEDGGMKLLSTRSEPYDIDEVFRQHWKYDFLYACASTGRVLVKDGTQQHPKFKIVSGDIATYDYWNHNFKQCMTQVYVIRNMVMETFEHRKRRGPIIHLDGDKLNNSFSNLFRVTFYDNRIRNDEFPEYVVNTIARMDWVEKPNMLKMYRDYKELYLGQSREDFMDSVAYRKKNPVVISDEE